MKLKSNNPRITGVELTNNNQHLTYFIDGKLVEVDGEMNFITDKITREYKGIRELALVRDENGNVIQEIEFEAYFNEITAITIKNNNSNLEVWTDGMVEDRIIYKTCSDDWDYLPEMTHKEIVEAIKEELQLDGATITEDCVNEIADTIERNEWMN